MIIVVAQMLHKAGSEGHPMRIELTIQLCSIQRDRLTDHYTTSKCSKINFICSVKNIKKPNSSTHSKLIIRYNSNTNTFSKMSSTRKNQAVINLSSFSILVFCLELLLIFLPKYQNLWQKKKNYNKTKYIGSGCISICPPSKFESVFVRRNSDKIVQ